MADPLISFEQPGTERAIVQWHSSSELDGAEHVLVIDDQLVRCEQVVGTEQLPGPRWQRPPPQLQGRLGEPNPTGFDQQHEIHVCVGGYAALGESARDQHRTNEGKSREDRRGTAGSGPQALGVARATASTLDSSAAARQEHEAGARVESFSRKQGVDGRIDGAAIVGRDEPAQIGAAEGVREHVEVRHHPHDGVGECGIVERGDVGVANARGSGRQRDLGRLSVAHGETMTWPTVVLALYLVTLAALSVSGAHRLWLLRAYYRRRVDEPPVAPAQWPTVTVQLPIYNERYVVRRLIEACGEFDYPSDRLQIQVLDDSTDDTTSLARDAVDELMRRGIDAALHHRDDRRGFKAGALEAGLAAAKGELIAIFDADFVPSPDFLRQAIAWFDDDIGMVQARWGHLNWSDSWLTCAQSTLLDGHFVVEHTARHASGRWFNFNGTAGVWRRACIDDAGGWQHDTLTEDLDLSYRAQLRGWKFRYLPDLIAPAELPPHMAEFKTQQHRWAKGSVQTARKLLAVIWRSDASLANKIEAHMHLTANLSYPLVVVLSLLLPWAVAARMAGGPPLLLTLDLVLFTMALLPFIAFYVVAIIGSGAQGRRRRLVQLPMTLALGLGMAVSQTRAVVEGIAGPVGTFVRTPKEGGMNAMGYRAASRGLVVFELAMAAYLSMACLYVTVNGYIASLPFLALFTVGYASVGIASLGTPRRPTHSSIASAGPHVESQSHEGTTHAPVDASKPVRTA